MKLFSVPASKLLASGRWDAEFHALQAQAEAARVGDTSVWEAVQALSVAQAQVLLSKLPPTDIAPFLRPLLSESRQRIGAHAVVQKVSQTHPHLAVAVAWLRLPDIQFSVNSRLEGVLAEQRGLAAWAILPAPPAPALDAVPSPTPSRREPRP
jgi:hypothetical protein